MAHTDHTQHRQHSGETIRIHPQAPTKVAVGVACNGCGVCCLYAPCPLGMLLSRRRRGACGALRWDAALLQYRCGAIVAPQAVLAQALPRGLRRWAARLAPWLRQMGLRWIAAGVGCDSTLEVEAATMPWPDVHNNPTGSTAVRHPPP